MQSFLGDSSAGINAPLDSSAHAENGLNNGAPVRVRGRLRATLPKVPEQLRSPCAPPNYPASLHSIDETYRILLLGEEPMLSDEEKACQHGSRRKVRSKSASGGRSRSCQDSKLLLSLGRVLSGEIDSALKLRHAALEQGLHKAMREHVTAIQRVIKSTSLELAQKPAHLAEEIWQSPLGAAEMLPVDKRLAVAAELPGVIPGANGDAHAEMADETADSDTSTSSVGDESPMPPSSLPARSNMRRANVTHLAFSTYQILQQESRLERFLRWFNLDEEEMKRIRSTKLWRLTHNAVFTWVTASMIFAYTVFIGISSEVELKTEMHRQPATTWTNVVEVFFVVWFTLELAVRFLAEKRYFLLGLEWRFNMLDFVLVLLSIIGFVLDPSGSGTASKANAARIFRLFRFVRVLRIVRVIKSFQSLRLLAFSIIESFASLMWCFIVVVVVIYLFAIFILNGVTEHYRALPDGADVSELAKYWGGVIRAMTSLFKSISGGMDWDDLLSPLRDVDWFYEPVFCFYVFFMLIGVLNVIVATFVENTAQVARNDKEANVKAELSRVKEYSRNIKKFFAEADHDRSGHLTWDEFEAYLENDEVKAYFQTLELDVSEAHVLFKLLAGDDEEVSIEEFCDGCMRLKGKARSIDVNLLIYQTEKMIDKTVEAMETSQLAMKSIGEKLGIKVGTPAAMDGLKLNRPSHTF
eukprot:TRINITY_DN58994_c0_g1_i1.p1 TRINITY_DN58994_c0_g1~~TRINITY_DN58994_c0_g1_i1.p1  ORF type:complete len:696 (+),score=132.23 TRINITY_DN58994_c0_g1_i1:144-2231(+)